MLKRLYLAELTFIADKLSQDRKKWRYDKRNKRSVIKAITSNVEENDLIRVLEESCGKRMPSGDSFPDILQFEEMVFGPLGFLRSSVERDRYEAETVGNILTRYVQGENLLDTVIGKFCDEVPKEVLQLVTEKEAVHGRAVLKQLFLTYSSNEEICNLINELLAKEKIKIDIQDFYENPDYPWIITRYGLVLQPEKEPINNLVNLVSKYYADTDLEPELREYAGDFPTRLLEYCIMESPEVILGRLFGIPQLRKIAKRFGFVADKVENSDEIVKLVLLGLGFNVPPPIAGVTAYLRSIQKLRRDLPESRDIGWRSGIMSRVFVEMERALRDLAYFYIAFLWNEQLGNLKDDIEEEMSELTPRQVGIKALDIFIRKKFRIKKSFEKLGFGDFIGLIRMANKASQVRSLKNRMAESFGRTYILGNKETKLLDSISPYRSSFAHTKDYPGDEKCDEIVRSIESLLEDFRLKKICPIVMRVSKEVSDEYGKSYAECIDENGEDWLLYTDEYLETSLPHFVHSKTSKIAVNPVIVEKIF
jgi:hypothetical protein